jgi:hypothetical protein
LASYVVEGSQYGPRQLVTVETGHVDLDQACQAVAAVIEIVGSCNVVTLHPATPGAEAAS